MKELRMLRQCLIDTELAHLRVIARLWGVTVKASRQLEIAVELAAILADPEQAAEIWYSLPEEGRAALVGLLDAGGLMAVPVFTRHFGEIRPMGPGRLERETPWRDPISPAEMLWYRGLIYEGFAEESGETYPVYFVPPELQAALPVKAGAAAASIQVRPVASPVDSLYGGDLLFDDLTTVLAFAHNEIVRSRVGSVTDWPRELEKTLLSFLRDPNSERLAFILHLIDQLGWMRVAEDGRFRLVAEPVLAWLQEKSTQGQKALVHAWCQMADWNELWRMTNLQTDDVGGWHNDPTLARIALLRHLGALAPSEWVRIDDFVNAIKEMDPDFQRPGGDYETWYVRDAASGEYLSGFESWDRVEGVLLRVLLIGPAWWLGLVELGGTAVGSPSEVFLPRVAATEACSAEPASPVVRPDLTVVIPAARRFERFQLARVADLMSVDELCVYRLTPGSLKRAQQQRIDVERVLSFLDGLSDAPLPGAVRSSLIRWAERGTEIWLEQTVLLEVVDEKVMQQILASPRTARYIDRVVGTTAAVVTERDWQRLVAALSEMGLLAELVGWTRRF